MTTYQDLDWDSLDFIRQHLYKRVANPLDNALGRLLIAEHMVQDASAKAYLSRVSYGLEVALNALKAWAALIHVQHGEIIGQEQRRAVSYESLPDWLKAYLSNRTSLKVAFTRPVWVHPETFYEGLVLLCGAASAVGTLKAVIISDAPDTSSSIWVRAVFTPRKSERYTSLENLLSRAAQPDDADDFDVVTAIDVMRALFAINGAELRVQDNLKTGEQALAVQFAAMSASQIATTPIAPGREANDTPAERAPLQPPAGEASEMPPTVDTALDVTADTSASAAESAQAETSAGAAISQDDAPPVPAPSPRVLVQEHLNKVEQPATPDETPDATPAAPAEDAHTGSNADTADKDDTLRVPALDWREQLARAGYVPGSEASKLLAGSSLLATEPTAPSAGDAGGDSREPSREQPGDEPHDRDAQADAKPAATAAPRAADTQAGDSAADDQPAARPAAPDPDAPVS